MTANRARAGKFNQWQTSWRQTKFAGAGQSREMHRTGDVVLMPPTPPAEYNVSSACATLPNLRALHRTASLNDAPSQLAQRNLNILFQTSKLACSTPLHAFQETFPIVWGSHRNPLSSPLASFPWISRFFVKLCCCA